MFYLLNGILPIIFLFVLYLLLLYTAPGQMRLTAIQKAQLKRQRDRLMEELNSALERVRLTTDEFHTAEAELEVTESPSPEYETEEEERKEQERKMEKRKRIARRKKKRESEQVEEMEKHEEKEGLLVFKRKYTVVVGKLLKGS